MKKLLKKILKIILVLIGALIVTILVIAGADIYHSGYLKIKNNGLADNSTYLIKNVNIVPMDTDTVLVDKTVYIKEGIIEKIGDQFEVSDVQIIDAKNKYLLPGLIDMHVHVWDRYELGLYLSNGVTAVRNLWGMPMHLRIKQAVNNDEIISPMFFTSGPKLTGTEFIGDDNLNLSNPDEGREKVISYKDRGYDFIKTYYGLDKEIFDAVLEQANSSEIDIVAHPSQKVPFSYHVNQQIKSIEHAEEIVQQPLQFDMDIAKMQAVIDSLSSSGNTAYCPTLIAFYNIYRMMMNDAILDSESIDYMNPMIRKADSKSQFDRWYNAKQQDPEVINRIKTQHDFHLTIVSKLHESGVPVICGTDAGIGITIPGYSIHQELAFYKEAGLSNYEVLKTATVNPSRTHQIMSELGTVEVGKVANLLLVDKNPLLGLSALKKPSTVFVKGKKLDREVLDGFEERARNRKNLIVSGLRYAENLIIEK